MRGSQAAMTRSGDLIRKVGFEQGNSQAEYKI